MEDILQTSRREVATSWLKVDDELERPRNKKNELNSEPDHGDAPELETK